MRIFFCLELRYLELGVGLAQSSNFFDRIATNWISKVFFRVFKPRVESRSFLGKSQVQLFNLTELILHAKETLLAGLGSIQKRVPACNDISVTVQDRLCLFVTSANKLILQGCDVLDTLLLEGMQTSIEGFLLGQQSLHRGQVTTEIFRTNVVLLVGNPRFDNIRFPHKLQVSSVVQKTTLAALGN